MPVHSALVYAASRLVADSPKDRLVLVITVIAASLLASSIASVTINRITCYSENRSQDGLPTRISDRVLATVVFCLFLMSITLMLFHLTHL